MRVRFSKSADADLDNSYFYIALQQRPQAAARMLEKLFDAVGNLADFPFIGRLSGELEQRELTTVYRYIIVYVVRAGSVEITRIHHGAQDR